jgi:hypothetical protein
MTNLNKRQLDRIAKTVKKSETTPINLVSEGNSLLKTAPFWARITGRTTAGSGAKWYSFVKQKYKNDGSLEDDSFTGTLNAYEVDNSLATNNTKVLMWFAAYDGSGNPIYAFRNTTPRACFPVLVTQTGGSAGDNSTACSYTYTVTDLNGNSLLTGASPSKRRTSVGAYSAPSAGSYGLAFTEVDGTVKLYDANEVPVVEVCT